MDQTTRNKLRSVVTQSRKALEEAIAQALQGQFGVFATGKKDEVQVEPDARMTHLSDEDRAYRKDILDHFGHVKALGYKPKDALAQLVREIAFTHLNRLCAYLMMESRGLIRESVSKGMKSQGFLFYLADHEADERRFNKGEQDVAYRHFLNWLGGTLSEEVGVLFSPTDPANRLYPAQRVLDEVLDLLNADGLAGIWDGDEAVGWVYQYFTPKELRDQARKKSSAPRNSYELAFRNQFFTPRYVVEFLTDNTLGRIWYEMRKGDTLLKCQCRYMVRRPNEVFLPAGENPPQVADNGPVKVPQDDLQTQAAYVRHRAKKDPRELKILDPACGSGHFLLYCFDILVTIYEEAYADKDLGPALQQDYPTLDALRRDVPRLILASNLHGIDIDLRATQIAALALWLRCQRAYQEMGLTKDRPLITRSNIVCAEPMPGEHRLLTEFVGQLEPKLLGQLVEAIFDKMALAGEAGSLLRVEEEIQETVAAARRQWIAGPLAVQQSLFEDRTPVQRQLRFDLSGVSDTEFFDQAEAKVVEALRDYGDRAYEAHGLQRRLFADDATQGFAFVDLCRQRFSVVLMNPPFGQASLGTEKLLIKQHPVSSGNLFAMFVLQAHKRLEDGGVLGAITPRTFLVLASFDRYREHLLGNTFAVGPLIDLGWEVLDEAQVEVCAFVAGLDLPDISTQFFDLFDAVPADKPGELLSQVTHPSPFRPYLVRTEAFKRMPNATMSYRLPPPVFDSYIEGKIASKSLYDAYEGAGITGAERYIHTWWEVPQESLGNVWFPLGHGGEFAPYFRSIVTVIDWENDGQRPKHEITSRYPYLKGNYGLKIKHERRYMSPGLSYGKRTDAINASILPADCIFSHEGQAVFPHRPDEWRDCLAYLNSNPVRFCANQICGGHKLAGYVSRLPFPDRIAGELASVRHYVDALVSHRYDLCKYDETSRDFCFPSLTRARSSALSLRHYALQDIRERLEREVLLKSMEEKIDKAVDRVLGTQDLRNRASNTSGLNLHGEGADEGGDDASSEDEPSRIKSDYLVDRLSPDASTSLADLASAVTADEPLVVEGHTEGIEDYLSYSVGVAFGRWDVRVAVSRREPTERTDWFAPFPTCSPGMLQGHDGLPAASAPESYEVRIAWDGILVDDPEHQDDIVRHLQEVNETIWHGRTDRVEEEMCEALGVKKLRDYFRKPGKGGFWDDHVFRYSKSRRKAPIYWLLQSSRKNYALWLYYHRLDKDLLFKALLNYVEPKIRLEENRLDSLRIEKSALGNGRGGSKKLDKELEKQEELLSELRDFEEKLRKAANLHLNPDRNDGVGLNIASLHELGFV